MNTPAPTTGPDEAPAFTWFYALAFYAARTFFQTLSRAEAVGVENVPRTGPFLLASNHASFFDPPLLGCFLPRPICYTPRKTLWKPGPMSWMLNRLKCIPVDRDSGHDIGAFKRVFAALAASEGVLVFPEGTRTRDGRLQPPHRGVGLLAARYGVPVVPARVFGTYETFPRGAAWPRPFIRLGVRYGAPLLPAAYDPGPRVPLRYETIAERIMAAIAALPPPEI
jgi:1-acyl-sn-glycerol-3-phosphate acyltransferase